MKGTINTECQKCTLRFGCFAICCAQPKDVLQSPCEKYAIGLSSTDGVFWTRPADDWKTDPMNPSPKDLLFVIL